MPTKPANETIIYPFTNFNFSIEIRVEGVSNLVCNAAFSECDGLEMTREVKTIREGGANNRQIRLSGPVTYGQLTLKRGMTETFDLWEWFSAVTRSPSLRADATVVINAPDGRAWTRFVLRRCIPIKLKAPPLNAANAAIAIEELGLAYEALTQERPKG